MKSFYIRENLKQRGEVRHNLATSHRLIPLAPWWLVSLSASLPLPPSLSVSLMRTVHITFKHRFPLIPHFALLRCSTNV